MEPADPLGVPVEPLAVPEVLGATVDTAGTGGAEVGAAALVVLEFVDTLVEPVVTVETGMPVEPIAVPTEVGATGPGNGHAVGLGELEPADDSVAGVALVPAVGVALGPVALFGVWDVWLPPPPAFVASVPVVGPLVLTGALGCAAT